MSQIYFVSGIHTDAGKSYATAFLARKLSEDGKRVITQKFIQTGCRDESEDIITHRRLMGCGMLPEDECGLTAPEIFSYPASPLLASKIDHRPINFDKINAATAELASRYDVVLVEGAGGLMVPLTEDMLTIDFIQKSGYPLAFVCAPYLGSVNHALLSFEAIKNRNLPMKWVIYNAYPPSSDSIIADDTREYLRGYVSRIFPDAEWLDLPILPPSPFN